MNDHLTLRLLGSSGGSLCLCLLSFFGGLWLGRGLGDCSSRGGGGLGFTLLHGSLFGLLSHGSRGGCLTLLKLSQLLLQLRLAFLQGCDLKYVET